jgi:hypothetical protein
MKHYYNKISICFLIFCCFAGKMTAQSDIIRQLNIQAELMLGLHSFDTIQDGYSQFSQMFVKELKKKNSFKNRFDSLDCVSILYPADSSFRVLSWQAKLSESKFAYSGCVQTKDSLFVLKSREGYFNNSRFTSLQLNANNWYGCLYYGLKSFKYKSKDFYLIFGMHQPGISTKRKIMDVLWFDKGVPVFGEAVFCKPKLDECDSRIMVEYSANAAVRMNYDKEYNMVIFDHLIKGVDPEFRGQLLNMPDGSYEGYKLKKNGKWDYVEMVWHDKQATPPTDKPKTTEKKRDILGR